MLKGLSVKIGWLSVLVSLLFVGVRVCICSFNVVGFPGHLLAFVSLLTLYSSISEETLP